MLEYLVHIGLKCGQERSWAHVKNGPGDLPEEITKPNKEKVSFDWN
jgi:hypothetical protein